MTHSISVNIDLNDFQYAVMMLLRAKYKQSEEDFLRSAILSELGSLAEYEFQEPGFDIRAMVEEKIPSE
jgi:hypothetical protein